MLVFVCSQEPEAQTTSCCKVSWYGRSVWFQSLGKLVPWREPSPSSLCRTKTDDRPKKLSQKRMYKQTGINPRANTAVSEAGAASIAFSVLLVHSLFFFFLFIAMTSRLLPLTLLSALHPPLSYPAPAPSTLPSLSLSRFRASVTIPSVALGIYLILVSLRGDGYERVSTEEEEEAVRACQAVNRR